MEFADGVFDFVFAWGCLMHMPNTVQAVVEIYRVLKSGGKAAGYIYNAEGFRHVLVAFLVSQRNLDGRIDQI